MLGAGCLRPPPQIGLAFGWPLRGCPRAWFLQVLKHKPEADPTNPNMDPIVNYLARTFFGPDHLPELEKVRKESKDRAKYG